MSWWRGLLHFFWLRPVRYFFLLAIIVGVIYWQWGNIVSWVTSIIDSTLRLFGWGLLLIALAFATIVGLAVGHKLSSLVYYWNRWLGGIVLIAAAWGILAFFNLGGSIGLAIAGMTNIAGGLRIFWIVVLGIILMIPRLCYRLIVRLVVWMQERMRKVEPKPARQPKQSAVVVPDIEPVRQPATRTPTSAQGLKQITQEVWKKYGESPSVVTVDGWRLPPIDILDESPDVQFSDADNVRRAQLIEEALASYGVEAKVVQINTGPTVTQFGIEPGWDRRMKDVRERDRDGRVKVRQEEMGKTRVKVERITSLANDLALALAAPSIRIEAPVPGQSVVGIEVPNIISSVVSLRGVIESSAFQKTISRTKLALALGKGAGGESVAADLSKMPHLLIAGATGSGKTVCLSSTICCLLMHNTPYDVRFIMVDPKRVELTTFNSIPHLAAPVIVDTEKALEALRWLNQEMDKRYQRLAAAGARNIEGYNKGKQGNEKMPHLVLIIDELADLMMTGSDEVERIICRLAQLARAVGIHLVVATQRPSVDVITGLIKANFPARISFAVTSQVDSRTILDGAGAEKLLGRGDMLYMPTEAGKPKRLQGCYVSDPETERLVYFWGSQQQEQVASLKVEDFTAPRASIQRQTMPEDPLLESVRQLAREHPQISASYLQRKLRIGYPRAARLMELFEEEANRGGERPN
jgi:S-DNA-T family DNA segregation ATPase FtsK/SpoIIIE